MLAPLKCSIQIDSIGKYCYIYKTGLYQYKDACFVPPLSMIDDIAGITSCDSDSVVLNGILNSKIESKKQKFHEKKSVFIHIGPNKQKCHKLKVHESIMTKSESQKYLGDVICSSGMNTLNIKSRKNFGFSTISQIKSILSEVKFGTYTIQS